MTGHPVLFLHAEDGAIAARGFLGEKGGAEHFIAVAGPGTGSFARQLAEVERRYAEALRALGLGPETAVLRRIFLSDVANQSFQVEASALGREEAGNPVAIAMIGQPPLPGAKIALQAYHVSGSGPVIKRRLSPRHLLVEKDGLVHVWSTRLCAGQTGPGVDVEAQTEAIFAEMIAMLAARGATLRTHCLRTWIYMKDVDAFYAGVVEGRKGPFASQGLNAETHFIASTGIEGACPHQFDAVSMDAYSLIGLPGEKISFLNDFSKMCEPKAYGIAFERGTRLAFADRTHYLISGTASIDAEGRILHQGDVLAQLDRALGNIEAILKAGGAGLADMMSAMVYLRDATDYPLIAQALEERLPGLPATILHAPVCRPGWLVEVEGIAVTGKTA